MKVLRNPFQNPGRSEFGILAKPDPWYHKDEILIPEHFYKKRVGDYA